ncbi:MAG: hypothetical protein U9Q03_04415 [Patescibacteria group bacterium]|nr:hypothetical protein [Patescibacteria group bacterium]
MENHWTALDAAKKADECMAEAERLLAKKDFLHGRTEINLAQFHLQNAERVAEKSGERLLGIYRSRLTSLKLKLRWRDHILTWLGF